MFNVYMIILIFILLFILAYKYFKPSMINVLEDLYFVWILYRKHFTTNDNYLSLLSLSSKNLIESILRDIYNHQDSKNLIYDDSYYEYIYMKHTLKIVIEDGFFEKIIKEDRFIFKKMQEKFINDWHFLSFIDNKFGGRFNGKYFWKGKKLS